MTSQQVEQVYAALTEAPSEAPRIAARAGVSFVEVYEALVQLYDAQRAFLWQEPVTRRMRWQR